MLKKLSKILFCGLIGYTSVYATTISNLPIGAVNPAKPNIIFILDNSGSMDFESLEQTNDGALWWDSSVKSFTDNSGKPFFNASGNPGPDGTHIWYKYAYLFPNGSSSDARINLDATYYHLAIPPTPAYAFMRCSAYNPIYYDTNINYSYWTPAYINGATMSFANAVPTAARSHPAIPLSGGAVTINLTANLFSTASNWTFRMLPGMTIPGATMSGTQGKKQGTSSFVSITSNYLIPNNEVWDVAFNYYPATFYVKDSTCSSGPQCATAPDGNFLRQYQIKPGNTFPSGRSYTAEMQNFANWFTYYRKRKLLLASVMGQTLSQMSSVRGGIVNLNGLSPVTMVDFDATNSSSNAQSLLGTIYLNASSGDTPTRAAVKYVGSQFMANKNIIQYGCQANAAMVMTDGFANAELTYPPTYNANQWGSGTPYQTIYPGTLGDLGLAYYTLNLRSDLPTGLVPVAPNVGNNSDQNSNLHMNLYALSLATKGTIYGTGTPQALNPFANPPAWPNPNIYRSPTAVDDLWHATINARGLMASANNVTSVSIEIQNLLESALSKTGAGSAITVSNVNLSTTANTVYSASFNDKAGDLQAYSINLTTGSIQNTAPLWSAQNQLDQRTAANRILATYNGTAGIPLEWANLPGTMQTLLNSSLVPPGPSDGALVLNWLRGDKSLEGTSYRTRQHLLGDIVDADPVLVAGAVAQYTDPGYANFMSAQANRTPVVYQGANDGYLHAFNALTGNELWAYMPNLVFGNVAKLSSMVYSHQFYVDGTPFVGDAFLNNAWHTLLIGGLRAGGKGYYALDITAPVASNETNLATKVLWEFPNPNTAASVAANVGLSFGQPLLVKTPAAGWVVLVTSGYNNSAGDGKGHLFVLNPVTGQLIKDISTTSGSSTQPSGLAQVSAFAYSPQTDVTVDYVYGGDLNGNLWRFDLSGSTTSAWNVQLLATLVDSQGNPQPITAIPELTILNNRRMVYIGTGQLLGAPDLTSTQTQTMYALVDNMTNTPTISPLRTNLVQRTVVGNTVTGNSINYANARGWYVDLPSAGERITTNPILAYGAIVFNSNQPSAAACTSSSYQYVLDQLNGVQISNPLNPQQSVARYALASSYASRPVIVVLPNGSVESITHNANDTFTVISLPITFTTGVVKKSWREIFQ